MEWTLENLTGQIVEIARSHTKSPAIRGVVIYVDYVVIVLQDPEQWNDNVGGWSWVGGITRSAYPWAHITRVAELDEPKATAALTWRAEHPK